VIDIPALWMIGALCSQVGGAVLDEDGCAVVGVCVMLAADDDRFALVLAVVGCADEDVDRDAAVDEAATPGDDESVMPGPGGENNGVPDCVGPNVPAVCFAPPPQAASTSSDNDAKSAIPRRMAPRYRSSTASFAKCAALQ
jgi:hypothetical protein